MGAPFWRLLVLFCVIPTGWPMWGWERGEFAQQVSVELLSLRQCDLEQETLHHQLIQLWTQSCDTHNDRFIGELKTTHIQMLFKSINTDRPEGETGAPHEMMNLLFPESDVTIFWVQLLPVTIKLSALPHVELHHSPLFIYYTEVRHTDRLWQFLQHTVRAGLLYSVLPPYCSLD